MLKISGAGWANIIIEGNVVFDGSYLTDIPCDFMKALYDYFNNFDNDDKRFSSSVYVDCEGGVANFVFSDMAYSGSGQKVFMFYPAKTKTGWEIQTFDVDPYYLAIELIEDIENDFENWVKWGSDDSKKGLQQARKNLNYWLNKLKKVMKDKKPYAEQLKAWNTPGTPENNQIEKVRKSTLKDLENKKEAIPFKHIKKHIQKD